jgi:hypothetical protein
LAKIPTVLLPLFAIQLSGCRRRRDHQKPSLENSNSEYALLSEMGELGNTLYEIAARDSVKKRITERDGEHGMDRYQRRKK